MARTSYTPESIINKLRKAEVPLSQGARIGEAARKSRSYRSDLLSLAKRIRWDEDWRDHKIKEI